MPIDPSIPLRGVQAQVAMPWEIEQQQLTLRDLMDQRKVRAMQLEQQGLQLNEMKRAQGAQERIRQILATTPDLEKALPQIYAADPASAISLRKSLTEQQKANFDLRSTQNKVSSEDIELVGRLAGGVRAVPEQERPAAWANALATAKALGKDVSQLPAQYNPAVVDQLLQWALDAKAQEQRRQWEVTNNREQTKFDDEQVARALQEMGAARGQADFDRILGTVPPNLRNRLPAMYSPATVDYANRSSMTSAQRNTADQQATTFAETKRHNQVAETAAANAQEEQKRHNRRNEGIAAGALDARRDALNAAQKKGSEAYNKKLTTLVNMEKSLAAYGAKIDTVGPQWRADTPEYRNLKSEFKNIQMDLKNAYELGALAGPDLSLLEDTLTDPTSMKGNFIRREGLKAQLEAIKSRIKREKETLRQVYQREQAQDAVNDTGNLLNTIPGISGGMFNNEKILSITKEE